MFFFDEKLNRRNVSDVTMISVGRPARGRADSRLEHDITFKSGEKIIVLDLVVDEIMNSPVNVIPAQPGLLAVIGADEDGSDLLSPVLGWATTWGGAVRPILQSGVNDGNVHAELAIIQIDGSVRWLGFNHYPSLSAFNVAHQRGFDPDRLD